jgi:hypothetical protein
MTYYQILYEANRSQLIPVAFGDGLITGPTLIAIGPLLSDRASPALAV